MAVLLKRAQLLGVCIRAPDFWRLPYEYAFGVPSWTSPRSCSSERESWLPSALCFATQMRRAAFFTAARGLGLLSRHLLPGAAAFVPRVLVHHRQGFESADCEWRDGRPSGFGHQHSPKDCSVTRFSSQAPDISHLPGSNARTSWRLFRTSFAH